MFAIVLPIPPATQPAASIVPLAVDPNILVIPWNIPVIALLNPFFKSLKGAVITPPMNLKALPNVSSAALAILSLIANPISERGPMIFFSITFAPLVSVLESWNLIGVINASANLDTIPVGLELPSSSSSYPNSIFVILPLISNPDKALPATAPMMSPIGPPNRPAPASAPTDAAINFFRLETTSDPSFLSSSP